LQTTQTRKDATAAPGKPATPIGAWTESDAPPPVRRIPMASILRSAVVTAPPQIAQQRQGGLVALDSAGPMSALQGNGGSPEAARTRPEQTNPATRADTSEARVVLLRRDEERKSNDARDGRALQPAGANAASEPSRADETGDRSPPAPRAPEAPARTTPITQPMARAADGSRTTPSAQTGGRPLVLASQALRKDLAPATPAGPQVRKVTGVVSIAGVSAAMALCGPSGFGLPIGGAFLALGLLGLVRMPYQARAAALATVAGSGLAIVTWSRLGSATDFERLVLLIGVLLLSMALLFRSWHRASLLARALVALGASVCAGWLAMSDGLQKLLILEAGWQRWLPSVLPLPLAIVLLLSLLAFMDSRATGGCVAWAALLLGWYALHAWIELVPLLWPEQGRGFASIAVDGNLALTILSGPLLVIVLAAALAQLLSVATAAETE